MSLAGRLLLATLFLAIAATGAAPQTRPGMPVPAQPQPQPQPQPRTPTREGTRPADPAARGTATLRGQVVAIDTGVAIRRAQVRVSGQTIRESRLATTDAQGRFEIRELPAGRYTLSASKGGFVTLQYGQRRPNEPGTPLDLADGQTLDKLVVGLPRGSVIGGRVTDEFGEPVVNATVRALRYSFVRGSRRLVPAGGSDRTDDQGQFRLFGLSPGDYIVSGSLRTAEVTDPSADDSSGYAPTYYPGTSDPGAAERVRVALAQENTSVSFGLIATKLVRLEGRVINSQGSAATGGRVVLRSENGLTGPGTLMEGGAGRIDSNGAFRISNVAPGRYQLQARTGGRADAEFSRLDVAVGASDMEGLTLLTAPGARIRGSVDTDTGEATPFGPSQVTVRAESTSGDMASPGGGGGNARLAANWTFELPGVTDTTVFRVNAPPGWALLSITLNGKDITDTPMEFAPGQTVNGLEVLLTRRLGEVSGMVTNDRGEPVLDATVVIFPADEALRMPGSRHIKTARPNQEGKYTIASLPSGDYLSVAVQALQAGQASDPDFLETISPGATRVSVEQAETRTLNLSLLSR
jgi:hypothetical protein